MRKTKTCIAILICSMTIGCSPSKSDEKGDYILDKVINSDKVPTIGVVQNITKKEAVNQTISDFLSNDDPEDVIYYHIEDVALYNDLKIDERVTVTASPYIMQSYPPQAVATDIKRYNSKSD